MKSEEISEIISVYNEIEKHKTINWDEINKVYEYFTNKIEVFPRDKVRRIKKFVEEKTYDIEEIQNEKFERTRLFYSILLKGEYCFPKKLPKRKQWINKVIWQ